MAVGVIELSGPVLSKSTVIAIEKRMLTRATAGMIATRAAKTLIKPKPYKAIPYIGWAITIGATLYAGYEAYNATYVNFKKLQAETYSEEDINVFRGAYTQATAEFLRTAEGRRV